MIDHPSQMEIECYLDGESAQQDTAEMARHLTMCLGCSTRALAAVKAKTAIRQAGALHRTLPDALRQRLTGITNPPGRMNRWIPWLSSALAACLLAAVFTASWQRVSERNGLSAEMLDQHIALLANGTAPQVLSSDKHTIRPWYQGKIPFTFNLPDTLPSDTRLEGANLAYIHGEATAVLLYRIRKHPVSVYVMARNSAVSPVMNASRSGFAFRTAETSALRLTAVSDATADDLQKLMTALVEVQSP